MKNDYSELLRDPRWIKKRNEILTRDKNTCQYCGCQDKYMQVHHRHYWKGYLPWEYPDEMLVTLCEDCHTLIHQKKMGCDVQIGQVYMREHSDYLNTCIVYSIDYQNKQIKTLECDDGAGLDCLWDETSSFAYFEKHYRLVDASIFMSEWCFHEWFVYVSENLEETPMAFQYRWREILTNNPSLVDLINMPFYDE